MKQFKHQRGMTLVELMVAGLLSVIAVVFITNILLTSNRTALQSEGLAQAQENGRFILTWLQSNLRRAGYPYPKEGIGSRIQPFADACASASPLPPAAGADCTLNTGNGLSDRIAARRTYVSDVNYGIPADRQDCAGAAITGLTDGETIVDVYWVENNFTSGGGVSSTAGYNNVLRCVTYRASSHAALNSAQVIASGINSLRALYAFRGADNKMRYVRAGDLSATEWRENIRAVRVSVLTHAFSTTGLEQKSRQYILLDAAPITYNDQTARSIQSTTIFLPNEQSR